MAGDIHNEFSPRVPDGLVITPIANGDKAAKGTVARDPEVVAIVRVTALIDNLTEPGRGRVLAYLTDKYNLDGASE